MNPKNEKAKAKVTASGFCHFKTKVNSIKPIAHKIMAAASRPTSKSG